MISKYGELICKVCLPVFLFFIDKFLLYFLVNKYYVFFYAVMEVLNQIRENI